MKSFIAVTLAAFVGTAAALPPPMPSAADMSRGWDMVKGTQNGTQMGKVLLPVYEFHYTNGQVWSDPSDPTVEWSVPDELTITNVDFSDTLINEGVMNSYSDWINTKQENFDVSAGVKCGQGTKALSLNFKYNHESFTYHEVSQHDDAASGFSKHELALFSLETYPPELMPINPMFTRFIGMLPDSISSAGDQVKYNQLVQYWGTHFASYANFGGHVHVNTFVNKTFLQKHSSSWVKNQFALTFHYYMFDISGGGYVNKSNIHISSEFKEAATTYIFYRGGDLTLQSNATVLPWIKSIPQDPLWLNVTMSDMSALIADGAKAANLQKTIAAYVANGEYPSTEEGTDYDAMYADFEFEPLRPEHVAYARSLRNLRGRA